MSFLSKRYIIREPTSPSKLMLATIHKKKKLIPLNSGATGSTGKTSGDPTSIILSFINEIMFAAVILHVHLACLFYTSISVKQIEELH